MGVFSNVHRFREAGQSANVNNVARFGEPRRSLFTTTKVITLHHRIDILDANENVVYQAQTKFPSLHDKTDVKDAAGRQVAHIERNFFSSFSVTGSPWRTGRALSCPTSCSI